LSWRVINIQNPGYLKIKDQQLVFENEEKKTTTLPVEDISVLILESSQIAITQRCLALLQEKNVPVVFCDLKHMPIGLALGFHTHSRVLKVIQDQWNWTEPFKSRIWQKIVKQKLSNQARCLQSLELEGYEQIFQLMEHVQSGDKLNREAQAAKIYWPLLFGSNFRKTSYPEKSEGINAMIAYGYAIIRALLCRYIVGYGFLPALGVHHVNELNPYNLADDLIEPFRPVVDINVKKWIDENQTEEFDQKVRQYLSSIPNHQISINGQNHTITNACEKMVMSLSTATQEKNVDVLMLPTLTEQNE
jgi:CRISPR-associated protein Cas1